MVGKFFFLDDYFYEELNVPTIGVGLDPGLVYIRQEKMNRFSLDHPSNLTVSVF